MEGLSLRIICLSVPGITFSAFHLSSPPFQSPAGVSHYGASPKFPLATTSNATRLAQQEHVSPRELKSRKVVLPTLNLRELKEYEWRACCGRVPAFLLAHQTLIFPWKLRWISHSSSPVYFSKKIALLMCIMVILLHVRPNKNLDCVCTRKITYCVFYPSGSHWIFRNSFSGLSCFLNNLFLWK